MSIQPLRPSAGGRGWWNSRLLWRACPSHLSLWDLGRLSRPQVAEPSLQVERPRDLCKVSQPGIGSAQNCHPPQPLLCRSNACGKRVPGSWRNSRGWSGSRYVRNRSRGWEVRVRPPYQPPTLRWLTVATLAARWSWSGSFYLLEPSGYPTWTHATCPFLQFSGAYWLFTLPEISWPRLYWLCFWSRSPGQGGEGSGTLCFSRTVRSIPLSLAPRRHSQPLLGRVLIMASSRQLGCYPKVAAPGGEGGTASNCPPRLHSKTEQILPLDRSDLF